MRERNPGGGVLLGRRLGKPMVLRDRHLLGRGVLWLDPRSVEPKLRRRGRRDDQLRPEQRKLLRQHRSAG